MSADNNYVNDIKKTAEIEMIFFYINSLNENIISFRIDINITSSIIFQNRLQRTVSTFIYGRH